jgi:sugar porter (SP) family MFS transporter
MLNNIQSIPWWVNYFNDPSGETLGRLSAMYSIGSIASLPIVPFVNDQFGRRMGIIMGCFVMIAAASVQAAAQSLPMFEGARFFMGFGNSMAQLSSPLLLTELCHPQHRARVTAIYNCLWNVGMLINTWLSFGTQHISSDWSWRIPTLVQAFPSIIQISFIWFIPESPRWLISKDRTEDALNTLGKYHANGNIHDITVQFEYSEIKETLRLEFLYKRSSSYLDFFKTKGNRYRLLLIISLGLFSQWSGNGLISYYTKKIYESVGIDDPNTQLGLNGGNAILSLIVSCTCAMLCDRVGRRPLFLAATTGMLLFFMCLTIIGSQYTRNPSNGLGIVFVVFQWFFGIAYALAWSGLLVAYTVEILPYKLRAKGLMVMNFWVQVALTINTYVNPIPIDGAWQNTQWKLFACYTAWIAFELVFVYFLYIETRYISPPTLSEKLLISATAVLLSRKSPRSSMARTPRLVRRLLVPRRNGKIHRPAASMGRMAGRHILLRPDSLHDWKEDPQLFIYEHSFDVLMITPMSLLFENSMLGIRGRSVMYMLWCQSPLPLKFWPR